jgi:hypothetical protein
MFRYFSAVTAGDNLYRGQMRNHRNVRLRGFFLRNALLWNRPALFMGFIRCTGWWLRPFRGIAGPQAKIRVPFADTDFLTGDGIDLHQPVTGHFMMDFILGLIVLFS